MDRLQLEFLPDISRSQIFILGVSSAIVFSLVYAIFFLEPVRLPTPNPSPETCATFSRPCPFQ